MDGSSTRSETSRNLSLVLPAYNEAAGIAHAVAEADEALAAICDDYEILVVDDGSVDDTARIVEAISAVRTRVRLLRHDRNQGYGAALRTGFAAARYELVAFTDADGQFDLRELERLLPLLATHPIAVGYRIDRQDPALRCFLSRGYNLLARTLFGIRVRDIDCALKVFRRDTLHLLLPESRGFFVNTEMLTRARQERLVVAEVGVHHRPRLRGESKVSLGDVPRTLATLLPFWWTRIVFAGSCRAAASPPTAPAARLAQAWAPLLVLVVLASLLFFGRLRAPLLEPQEPRYAEIPRQMLSADNWLVPVLHGQPYLDKPPLLYWLVMASYQVFGVQDWAARLVPGWIGVLTVLATYLWGRAALGPRAGFLGALLLCLAPRYIYLGRMLTMDGLLALCVTASLATAYLATRGSRLGWIAWLGSAGAAGVGMLAKGPVALVLVAGPMFLHQFLDRRTARIGVVGWIAWLTVSIGMSAPWFLAILFRHPDFAREFFWRHHVERFLQPFDHQEPFWFYLPGLLVGLLPWALLLPGFVVYLFRRSRRAAARRPAGLGLALLAFAFGFLFFSAAGCKRAVYLLPTLPPLALALGCYLDVLLVRPEWAALWQRGSVQARRVALAGVAGAILLGLAAAVTRMEPTERLVGFFLGALALAGGLWLTRHRFSWALCGFATFAVLLLGIQNLLPAYNQRFALRRGLQNQAAHAGAGQMPILCYPQRWDSIQFYLPRADVRVFARGQANELLGAISRQPEAVLFLRTGRATEEIFRFLPECADVLTRETVGVATIARVRRRVDPSDQAFARTAVRDLPRVDR